MNALYVLISMVVFWIAAGKFMFDAARTVLLLILSMGEAQTKPQEAATEFGMTSLKQGWSLATDLLIMLVSATALVHFLVRG